MPHWLLLLLLTLLLVVVAVVVLLLCCSGAACHLQWSNHCTPAVAEVTKATLDRLLKLGATKVDVTVPDLDLVQVRAMV